MIIQYMLLHFKVTKYIKMLSNCQLIKKNVLLGTYASNLSNVFCILLEFFIRNLRDLTSIIFANDMSPKTRDCSVSCLNRACYHLNKRCLPCSILTHQHKYLSQFQCQVKAINCFNHLLLARFLSIDLIKNIVLL